MAGIKLLAAKHLAARGLSLFPLMRRTKLPAHTGWQAEATTDVALLEKWFSDDRYNIGVSTSHDLIVLDCDRKAEDGVANLRALAGEHVADLDATFTVVTPSNGLHYYFRGSPVKNSVSKLARSVDVRSQGGLVVGPGSDRADGKFYRVVNAAPIADAPQWLIDAISAAYVKADKVELATPVELDTDAAIAAATAYLDDAEPAIEGRGGNDLTYRTAARLKDYGVSEGMAGMLMLGSWNERCVPPWEADELAEVVGHAYEYGENSPGSASAEAMFEDLGDEPVAEAPKAVSRLQDLSPDDCAATAATARPYIIKGVLAARDFACVYGAPGAGKSLIAPDLGYMIAKGETTFGRRTRQGAVLYIAVEDPDGMKQRITALRAKHGPVDNFRLLTGVSSLLDDGDWKAVAERIHHWRPAVIFVDTLARAFPGIKENDTDGMSVVVERARAMSKWGAAVVMIHHNTKAGDDTPRGSGLLHGDLDMELKITADKDSVVRGSVTKNRNGGYDWFPAFKIGVYEIGEDSDGDKITAAYAEEIGGAQVPVRSEQLPASERAALLILRDLDDGAGVSRNAWRNACIATETAVSAAETVGARKTVFNRVLRNLIERKLVQKANIDGQAVFTETGTSAATFEALPDEPLET